MTTPYEIVAKDIARGPVVKSFTRGVPFEDAAIKQVLNLAEMPFIHKHVAVMPDVHAGIGATVGSVIATKGAIIPAAVGVDIGCGMMALRTGLTASDLPENLSKMRSAIESAVPHGRTDNGGTADEGSWKNAVPDDVYGEWCDLLHDYAELHAKEPKLSTRQSPSNQLGTLGTGNHFIEVCLDEAQRVWVMLHSGSRGIGNRIGQVYIEKAKRDMERWFINLPDKDLAYIPEGSENFGPYMRALSWAQSYARVNREVMMRRTLNAVRGVLGREVGEGDVAVNCHHNYVNTEKHFGEKVLVTRKGAVRAALGDLGIIPGSMGERSFIVRGKGNPDSFNSCSHGAGRMMSRTAAKKTFTLADHAAATAGVECRKDSDVLDETPKAYKDIDAVMKAQESLVEIVHTLKQVLCVKG
jgi:tRNA-splicing ligase RtcB